MGRMLVIVILLLGGACPGELSSSHLTLNSTQKSFESFLISCMVKVAEERVTQVHWKERHPDGKYSMIAVQIPHSGNSTHMPYNTEVKLNKLDDTTYTLETAETDKVVCCEVVTYPSGRIQESCLKIEGNSVSGDGSIKAAVLGIGGFFVFGSFLLLCHILCMKKNARRVFNLRGASQAWNRNQRSRVPYLRTPPSINHAYEPPPDTEPLYNETVQRTPHRQTALGNPLTFEAPPPRTPQYQEIPPLRNQWFSEASAVLDPPSYPNSSSEPLDTSSSANHLYSNIHRHKRPHLKAPHLRNPQNDSPSIQPEPEALLHASSTRPESIHPHHIAPWLYGETSYLPEDTSALQPPRMCVPRTPDSPFNTINPMYHSRTGWTTQQGNTRFKYQHATLS